MVQAEDAQLIGAVQVDTNHAGFNGSGFVNYNAASGGSVQLNNVDGGCGGTATLSIRYALAAAARSGDLIVNGAAFPITFPSTGSWAVWDVLTVTITLNPGATNMIALNSTGQDLGNTDEFTIVSNGI